MVGQSDEGQCMTTTTVAPGYVGWLRSGRGPWRRVADGLSTDAVLADLMSAADATAGTHKDLCVLPSGQTPSGRPKQGLRGRHDRPTYR
jgi:hypothetical protein